MNYHLKVFREDLCNIIKNSFSLKSKLDNSQITHFIKEIKNLIKDAHSALVDVVTSIVKGQVMETTTTE